MGDSVTIRVAGDVDADSIAALINAAFKVERFFVAGDRIRSGKVLDMMRAGKYLLAEGDGALVASVYVELRAKRTYFGLLAVAPRRQAEGWGRRMVEEAESYARKVGCWYMDLRIVNLCLELLPFYERLGYVETGTAPFAADAQPSQPCHFVNMTKPLGASRASEQEPQQKSKSST